MRIAALDLGTNSIRLLIGDFRGGILYILNKSIKTTRLGEGLVDTGCISTNAVARTIDHLKKFNREMEENKTEFYRAVATSAIREAQNGKEFVQEVTFATGLDIDIITGDEEAYLSFQGVTKGLKLKHAPLVVDLGGGSIEFITLKNGVNLAAQSIPIGAVKATEQNLSLQNIQNIISDSYLLAQLKVEAPRPLVFVGGTATTLAAIKLGLHQYNAKLVHGSILNRGEIQEMWQLLQEMPLESRKRVPGLQPERADIILQGILIILIVMDYLGIDRIIVSESDILEGIAWQLYSDNKHKTEK